MLCDEENNNNDFQSISHNDSTLTNILKPAPDKIELLAEKYPNFHRLNLTDCLSKIQIPKIHRRRDHIFIYLVFIDLVGHFI